MRAKGDFQRSPFGIDFLVDKGLLGDEVKVAFYGELLQQPPGDDAGACGSRVGAVGQGRYISRDTVISTPP